MQNLDVGIWSGFKRKTELAESFLQPLITVGPLASMGTRLELTHVVNTVDDASSRCIYTPSRFPVSNSFGLGLGRGSRSKVACVHHKGIL